MPADRTVPPRSGRPVCEGGADGTARGWSAPPRRASERTPMRIRTLAPVAVAAILPFTLSACGGATVEDFCEQYDVINQLGESDGDRVKGELEELADSVPDDAGDDVREAVAFMADIFPEDGDLERALRDGDVSDEEAEEFASAAEVLTPYVDENCG